MGQDEAAVAAVDPLNPEPDDDALGNCQLLGGTALIVQAIMGTLVILSLVLKRQLERRKRSWRIWLWDVSKQLAGQAVIHLLNLVISDSVASAVHNNPCSLYFLNVLIDTTVGVAIFYFALKAATWFCVVYKGWEGFVSGEYGDPPQVILWWKQLMPYLSSIVFMKLVVLLPLTLPRISTSLIGAAHGVLAYLSPPVQVIFVMALFPLIMNVVQFCVVDQVIKANEPVRSGSGHPEDDESGYSLLPRHQQDDTADMGVGAGAAKGSPVDGEPLSAYNLHAISSAGMTRRNSTASVPVTPLSARSSLDHASRS